MINFIWIFLFTLIGGIISAIILVFLGYLFFDSILAWYIKRKIPKDINKFLDGGKDFPTNEKEVQLQDGQFREFERLRETAIRERASKASSNKSINYADKSRDDKLNAIASEHNESDIRTDETW